MTDDVRLDQHLGAVAHATLHRHVAAVDPDAELARLRARLRSADGPQVIGQLDRFAWRPAPSDGTPVTYPACAGTVSPAAVRMVVPADLATGRYTLCLDATTSIGSCAPVTVDAAPPTTAPAGGPAELDRSIFAGRADTGATLVVDEVAPDGSRTRQVAEVDDGSQRRPRSSVLPDGSVVALRDHVDFLRCTNDPIMRTVDGTVVEAPPQLGFARSVTATSKGLIVATRDVCPEGTTWGDPGTHWVLVSLDLTDPAASVNVLQTRLPDPSLVWYDQGGAFATGGEPRIVSASPDGSRVGFIDAFNPDDARWLLVDLAAPASMASLPSSCPLPGDIATEPRFVGNLVVVGRLCATLAAADESYSTIGQGSGVLRVEAIDLTDGVVVWSSAAAGVGANSYSRTAFVSADLADDGSLWVLLGAAGGVEQPTRWFVLHGDDVTEITRDDYVAFAFDPAELVQP